MDLVNVGQRSTAAAVGISIPLQQQYPSAMKLLLELLTKGRAAHENKASHKNTSCIQSLEGGAVRFAFSQLSGSESHWADLSPVTN